MILNIRKSRHYDWTFTLRNNINTMHYFVLNLRNVLFILFPETIRFVFYAGFYFIHNFHHNRHLCPFSTIDRFMYAMTKRFKDKIPKKSEYVLSVKNGVIVNDFSKIIKKPEEAKERVVSELNPPACDIIY